MKVRNLVVLFVKRSPHFFSSGASRSISFTSPLALLLKPLRLFSACYLGNLPHVERSKSTAIYLFWLHKHQSFKSLFSRSPHLPPPLPSPPKILAKVLYSPLC